MVTRGASKMLFLEDIEDKFSLRSRGVQLLDVRAEKGYSHTNTSNQQSQPRS